MKLNIIVALLLFAINAIAEDIIQLQEGVTNELAPGITIYINKIDNTNLFDIAFYDAMAGSKGQRAEAKQGVIKENKDGILVIMLQFVSIHQEGHDGTIQTITAEQYPIRIDLSLLNRK